MSRPAYYDSEGNEIFNTAYPQVTKEVTYFTGRTNRIVKKTIRQFTNGKGVTKETIRSVVLEMMKPQKERVLRQCQEHNQWKIEQIYGKKKGRYLTDDNYSLKSLMVLCYSMKFKNDVMNDLNGNIVWKKYGRAYSGRTLKLMVENGEFDWLLEDEEFIDIVERLFDLGNCGVCPVDREKWKRKSYSMSLDLPTIFWNADNNMEMLMELQWKLGKPLGMEFKEACLFELLRGDYKDFLKDVLADLISRGEFMQKLLDEAIEEDKQKILEK